MWKLRILVNIMYIEIEKKKCVPPDRKRNFTYVSEVRAYKKYKYDVRLKNMLHEIKRKIIDELVYPYMFSVSNNFSKDLLGILVDKCKRVDAWPRDTWPTERTR